MTALDEYHASVRNGATSERKVDDLLEAAIDMVPHARLTEIIFYGEKKRTTEEVAEEALYREALWNRDGELAILLHVYQQMKRVAEDPSAQEIYKNTAFRGVQSILKRIDNIKGSSIQ